MGTMILTGLMLLIITLPVTLVLVAVQRLLMRPDWFLLNLPAILLTFVPGTLSAYLVLLCGSMWCDVNNSEFRLASFHVMTNWYALIMFAFFWGHTLLCLGIWATCEVSARGRARQGASLSRYPNRVLTGVTVFLLVFSGGVTLFLENYKTLEDAVREGNVELTRKRLRFNLHGVDVRNGYLTHYGHSLETWPVLRLAPETGNVQLVKLLLEHGADLASEEALSGAIWAAARSNHVEMVHFLLDSGADPNWAMQAAAEDDAVDVLRALVDRGGDPAKQDDWHRNALDAAVVAGAKSACEFLSRYELKLTDLAGLMFADRLDLFQQALESGADPSSSYNRVIRARYRYGWPEEPILQRAVRLKKLPYIFALLEAGADATTRTSDKDETLLHVLARAVRPDHPREAPLESYKTVVQALMKRGVDPLALDQEGKTAVERAKSYGKIDFADFLQSVIEE